MATSSPAPLCDDVMREIFLRVSPADRRALVRAAACCRSWRRILSEAAFARDYRKLHGAPPMLGFLYEEIHAPASPVHAMYWVSRFVSTRSFRTPACQDRPCWHVLDSRYGLVLFYVPRMEAEFVVCDLVTGSQWEIHANPESDNIMWWEWDAEHENEESIPCNAAVLCANDRCDHLDCHGGPFRFALVGSVIDGSKARATFYSSETGEWSDMIEVQSPAYIEKEWHSAVVGNKVYVPCVHRNSVVEYDMDEQKLSVIDAPPVEKQPYIRLMGVEDGMLLFATLVGRTLYLWSMEAGLSGAAGWARTRVIELEPLLPPVVLSNMWHTSVVGFVEGVVSVFFLSTEDGLYTIDLNSGEHKKVHQESDITKVIPYMSFYTGA